MIAPPYPLRRTRAEEQGLTDAAWKTFEAFNREGPFVYFIVEPFEERSYVKIGWAKDPIKRLATLQTGNARHLVIRQLVHGGAALERRWHQRWATGRLSGEWFDPGYAEVILNMADAMAECQIAEEDIDFVFLDSLPPRRRRAYGLVHGFDWANTRLEPPDGYERAGGDWGFSDMEFRRPLDHLELPPVIAR